MKKHYTLAVILAVIILAGVIFLVLWKAPAASLSASLYDMPVTKSHDVVVR